MQTGFIEVLPSEMCERIFWMLTVAGAQSTLRMSLIGARWPWALHTGCGCAGFSMRSRLWDKGLCALMLALASTLTAFGAEAAIESQTTSTPPQPLPAAALANALREGGLVIYFRHTATDFSRNDSASRGPDDCDNQRPLTEQGRADARRIGAQVRALQLPVDEVLASPLCRAMDHARQTFARATATPALREAVGGDYPGLKLLLAQAPGAGRNRWLFGHGIPFRTVAGSPHLAEGEAVVMRPLGDSWRVVARIGVGEWGALPRPDRSAAGNAAASARQ
jgi:hypothetical protein